MAGLATGAACAGCLRLLDLPLSLLSILPLWSLWSTLEETAALHLASLLNLGRLVQGIRIAPGTFGLTDDLHCS